MPGDGKRLITPPGGKEVLGVDINGPKDFDKLNMDGASPVRTVKRGMKTTNTGDAAL